MAVKNDGPRPFAEVEDGELLVARVVVNENRHGLDRLSNQDRAAAINAAVEARVSGTVRAIAALVQKRQDWFLTRDHAADFWAEVGQHLPAVDYESVPGDVACGLAFDLGAAQAKVEGAWGVLFDEMKQNGGAVTDLALAIAKHIGLSVDRFGMKWWGDVTDDALRSECARRGWRDPAPAALWAEGQLCDAADATEGGLVDCPRRATPGSFFCETHGGRRGSLGQPSRRSPR